MSTTLEGVAAALRETGQAGDFATRSSCDAADLRITVRGVGALRFPLTAAQAKKLRAIGRPAPFGRGAETLRDDRVRNTWEVAKSRVKVDQRRWKPVLEPLLAGIAGDLGLPPESGLKAVLHKMLIYEPGQFFVTHQDSETNDDMIGTLVVVLPSRYRGGALVVHHNGKKKVFARTRSAGTKLSLIAFYADCRHEVRPVTSGYRVCLAYHLVRPGTAAARPAVTDPVLVDALADTLRTYFSTPVPRRRYPPGDPERPDRLVFLLDHEYTQRSLGWGRLKGSDRARAGALVEVAERLDCERHLVLADVHEVWGCMGSGYREWRRYAWADEDDEDRDDTDDYALEDLQDSEVELRRWVGPDGKRVSAPPSAASDHEICFTRPSVEMEPSRSEYEGYMGNYGNTMDRWYHRAALVIWPRDRAFVVRAKVSPAWAVGEIAVLLKRRQVDDARARARSLLPFWSDHARGEEGAAFFTRLVRTAGMLADAGLAAGLLEPFGAERLSRGSIPPFVKIVERYGADWASRVFEEWRKGWRASRLVLLPVLVSELEASDSPEAGEFACRLLEREVARFEERCGRDLDRGRAWLDDEGHRWLVDEAEPLLRACVAGREDTGRERLVSFLVAEKTAVPVAVLATLLRKIRGSRKNVPGLGHLYRHVVAGVRSIADGPERDRDDWSIRFALVCSCELCAELEAFLRDPRRAERDWPIAKDKRKHVHRMIDGFGLPVRHQTRRSGRPYTLRLRKDRESLFSRERKWRGRHAKLLDWLDRHRGAFEAGRGAR